MVSLYGDAVANQFAKSWRFRTQALWDLYVASGEPDHKYVVAEIDSVGELPEMQAALDGPLGAQFGKVVAEIRSLKPV